MKIFVSMVFALTLCPVWGYSQAVKIYNQIPNTIILAVQPIQKGFVAVRTQSVVYFAEKWMTSELLYFDHDGHITDSFQLRNYRYVNMISRNDTLYLAGYDHSAYPEISCKWFLELCDAEGNVIDSYENLFYDSHAIASIVEKIDDQTDNFHLITSSFDFTADTMITYQLDYKNKTITETIETNFLSASAQFLKIEKTNINIVWTPFGCYYFDSTPLNGFTEIKNDTLKLWNSGMFFKRHSKPGYIGFGGCNTFSSFYQNCGIILNEDLKIDQVDLLYDPITFGAPADIASIFTPFCTNKNYYYGSGMRNILGGVNSDTSSNQIIIVKYDDDLNRLWLKIMGGDRGYRPCRTLPRVGGGCALFGGVFDAKDNHIAYPLAIFIDEDGNLVNSQEQIAGDYDFTLFGNPGTTQLRLNAQFKQMDVTMNVSDMTGRVIATTQLQQGMNTLNTSDWTTGNYIITLVDNKQKILWTQQWVKVQ